MKRNIMIAAVLLFASLFAITSDAGQYQHWVIYYSDSSFTTPVGKKFQPNDEFCDAPYDYLHQTGSITIYRYVQTRYECGEQSAWTSCDVNGTFVTCPSRLASEWANDWWSLGEDW